MLDVNTEEKEKKDYSEANEGTCGASRPFGIISRGQIPNIWHEAGYTIPIYTRGKRPSGQEMLKGFIQGVRFLDDTCPSRKG